MLNLKIYKIHRNWVTTQNDDDDDDDDAIDGMGHPKPFTREVRFFDCIKSHRGAHPEHLSRYCVLFSSILNYHFNIGIAGNSIIYYSISLPFDWRKSIEIVIFHQIHVLNVPRETFLLLLIFCCQSP